jgi:hypothetical protein
LGAEEPSTLKCGATIDWIYRIEANPENPVNPVYLISGYCIRIPA